MNITTAMSQATSGHSTQNNVTESSQKTATESFKEFMEKTPEEMQFEAFLKRNNLTKEQFDELPSSKQEELLDAFEDEMKKKMGLL